MNAQAAARLDAITNPDGLLWHTLNRDEHGRSLGHRFRHCEVPDRKDWVFAIAEKAPPGQRWEDGSKWKLYKGLTRKQGEIIEATSNSDEEIVDRIIRLVLKGEDTTKAHQLSGSSGMTPDEVRNLILSEAKILATQMVESAKHRVGLQQKTKKPAGTDAATNAALIVQWKERATILGINPPELRKDGAINGIWLRRAETLWEAHLATPKT